VTDDLIIVGTSQK